MNGTSRIPNFLVRRCAKPPVRWSALQLVVTALLLSTSTTASAQTTPRFDLMPDLVALNQGLDRFPLYLRLTLNTFGGVYTGPNVDTSSFLGLGAAIDASIGGRMSDYSLNLQSRLRAPFLVTESGDLESSFVDVHDLNGSHRLRSRFSIGPDDRGDLGLLVDANAEIDHGDRRSDSVRFALADHPFFRQDYSVSVALRRNSDALAWVLPFEYSWQRVSYTDTSNLPTATVHRLGSSLGFRTPGQRWSASNDFYMDADVQFVHLSWARHQFDSQSSVCGTLALDGLAESFGRCFDATVASASDLAQLAIVPSPVEEISLRIADMQVVLGDDDLFWFGAGMHFGATWLWGDHREMVVFTGSYGLSGRVGGDVAVDLGIWFERGATPGADGRTFRAENRLEYVLGIDETELGFGASHRGLLNIVGQPGEASGEYEFDAEHIFHTEWYMNAFGLDIGVYHRFDVNSLGAAYAGSHTSGVVDGTLGELPEVGPRSEHQIGAFLRLPLSIGGPPAERPQYGYQ